MDEHLHDLILKFKQKLIQNKGKNTFNALISDKFWKSKGISRVKALSEKKKLGFEFDEFMESDELYLDHLMQLIDSKVYQGKENELILDFNADVIDSSEGLLTPSFFQKVNLLTLIPVIIFIFVVYLLLVSFSTMKQASILLTCIILGIGLIFLVYKLKPAKKVKKNKNRESVQIVFFEQIFEQTQLYMNKYSYDINMSRVVVEHVLKKVKKLAYLASKNDNFKPILKQYSGLVNQDRFLKAVSLRWRMLLTFIEYANSSMMSNRSHYSTGLEQNRILNMVIHSFDNVLSPFQYLAKLVPQEFETSDQIQQGKQIKGLSSDIDSLKILLIESQKYLEQFCNKNREGGSKVSPEMNSSIKTYSEFTQNLNNFEKSFSKLEDTDAKDPKETLKVDTVVLKQEFYDLFNQPTIVLASESSTSKIQQIFDFPGEKKSITELAEESQEQASKNELVESIDFEESHLSDKLDSQAVKEDLVFKEAPKDVFFSNIDTIKSADVSSDQREEGEMTPGIHSPNDIETPIDTQISNFTDKEFMEFSEYDPEVPEPIQTSNREEENTPSKNQAGDYEMFNSPNSKAETPSKVYMFKKDSASRHQVSIHSRMSVTDRQSKYKTVSREFNQGLLKIMKKDDFKKKNFEAKISKVSHQSRSADNSIIDLLNEETDSEKYGNKIIHINPISDEESFENPSENVLKLDDSEL